MAENLQRSAEGFWRVAFRQYRKNPLAMAGLYAVIGLFLLALFAGVLASNRPFVLHMKGQTWYPWFKDYPEFAGRGDFKSLIPEFQEGDWALFPLVPFGYGENRPADILQPPSERHWLGTDDTGRDLLARIIHGSRVSLLVGFVAVGLYLLVGAVLGALAGYYGGRVDAIISRITEIVICFPSLFLMIAVLAYLKPSIWNIMIVIGLTRWTGVARLVRGEMLKNKTMEYVTAARSLGASDMRIIFRHLLPNSMAPVLVSATFGVAGAIILETSLSFLGFGVQPPTPSWGEALQQASQYVTFAWWLVIFPGLAIFATVVAYNLVGEGLQDATDPRLRQ
ncbi:MAG: Oligopeptide transport system permease protein OppC [Myxococcota bacterium]|nr:Oligopeptide transport system permease protein OppC [Myxococcota bacterium]